jgi:hypothetical protein
MKRGRATVNVLLGVTSVIVFAALFVSKDPVPGRVAGALLPEMMSDRVKTLTVTPRGAAPVMVPPPTLRDSLALIASRRAVSEKTFEPRVTVEVIFESGKTVVIDMSDEIAEVRGAWARRRGENQMHLIEGHWVRDFAAVTTKTPQPSSP